MFIASKLHLKNPIRSQSGSIRAAWHPNWPVVSKSSQFTCFTEKSNGKIWETGPNVRTCFLANFFFYHLPQIGLWCTLMGLFNSSFYFCQTIDTHTLHMNQWAWEITIAGCSLNHFVPGAVWKSSSRCIYSFKGCLFCRYELNATSFWVAHWAKVKRHRRASVCGLDVD